MSNCIKDLYDYDLVKNCLKCGNISLKSNFHEKKNRRDGLQPICKFCVSDYNKNYCNKNCDSELERCKKYRFQNRGKIIFYEKNRRDAESNFMLAHNKRVRINKAFKSQNVRKTKKIFDLLGCSHSFFQRWITHELYGKMTLENYCSVRQIDRCLAIASFNLLDEKEMKKCFNWINLRPMYTNRNISKGSKTVNWLYLMQEVKAYQFIKLIEEERLN